VAKLSWVVGQEIWFFKEIPRAMSLAKELIDEFPRSAHGRVIVAERLTSAKGRFDRKWFAEKGGLWLAISLYNEILPQHFGLFSLLFGLAMVRTCHELSAKEVKLKWISDPHFRGKKLGGTLIESYKDWFIVGLGLNINNEPPEGLPAESLKRLIRREIPLTTALNLLLKWINYYYDALLSYERKFF
jgi:BirA family biotin operon repressor/biotin-[acetyl-CoA-carboxylase] ligase